MSFGFSAGDFFALTQLIFKTTKALSDSAGSKIEYQGLIQTLLSLLRSINSAEELALRCSLGSAGALDPNFVAPLNAIAREREICQKLIEAFLIKSEKYTASFIHGSGRAKAIKKLTWRLYHADDVQNLERELSIHVDAIQFYACGLGFQSLNASLASNTITLNKIDSRTTSIYDMINQLVAIMPKVMGYSWEGGCSADERPLRLLDALGRDLKIPALFLGSREVFHDMLEIVHRNLPGHKKIKSKEYSIADEDDEGHVVKTEEDLEWSQVVRAGKTVSINMMFKTYSHNKNSEKCPRCRSVTHGHTLEGKRRRCPVCQLTFHIFEEIRFEDPEEVPVPQPSLSNTESSGNEKDITVKSQRKTTKTKSSNKPKEREQDIFRRIHYVHELIQRRGVVVRSLGSQKTDKNDGKYLDDLPPLHEAAATGDLEKVKRLLKDNPADIESEGGCDSAKPLHYAAYQGRQDVAIFLLEHGAKLESGDCDGATPLHWSIPLGQIAMFRLLLESGANMNASTISGRTPIHWCAWKNQPAIARYLLDEGVDFNIQDDHTLTPLASCEGECSELISLLVDEGANVDISSDADFPPLHGIIEFASIDAVRTFLDYGPDVNYSTRQDLMTPLFTAMQREDSAEEACELLITHGAKVSGMPHEVMHEAVKYPSILRLLISHGADVESEDSSGRSVLHTSITSGQLASMACLLDLGADIHATDNELNTVLHFAMAQSNPDFVSKLIEAGAEVDNNAKLQNPLHWITEHSSGESCRILANHGANIEAFDEESNNPMIIAATTGNVACLEALIELGADPSMEDDLKSCPIHFAAHSGHVLAVEALLNAGVDADCMTQTEDGYSNAIRFAVRNNHHHVVQLLLDRGGDSTIFSLAWPQPTPIHIAASIGALESAKVLLGHDTAEEQLLRGNATGATPLDLAVREGHIELVKFLAAHPANYYPVEFEDLIRECPSPAFLQQMRVWFTEYMNRDLAIPTEGMNHETVTMERDDADGS